MKKGYIFTFIVNFQVSQFLSSLKIVTHRLHAMRQETNDPSLVKNTQKNKVCHWLYTILPFDTMSFNILALIFLFSCEYIFLLFSRSQCLRELKKNSTTLVKLSHYRGKNVSVYFTVCVCELDTLHTFV